MPTLYVLVGVPGSGKSTWAIGQEWAKDCAYVSTDSHVEKHAELNGKTYNEVFKDFMLQAVKLMAQDVMVARAAGQDIIWDQTSTTVISRRKKFDMLPDYYTIAVVFKTPEPAELEQRLNSRPGKIIPDEIVQDMVNRFEMPTLEEGFDEVWYAG